MYKKNNEFNQERNYNTENNFIIFIHNARSTIIDHQQNVDHITPAQVY